MGTANRYLHKLSCAEFRALLKKRYGDDCLAIKAYDYLCDNMNKEKGFIRKFSGEDYFIHPQAVAELLIEKVDATEICTIIALLHDCIEDMEEGTESEIRDIFGDEITYKTLLVTKKNDMDYHIQENLYSYLMKTLEAEEAVLVKLADRMNNNSTLSSASESKRKKKTEETVKYFVPLAQEARKAYPHNSDFYTEAENFFMQDID